MQTISFRNTFQHIACEMSTMITDVASMCLLVMMFFHRCRWPILLTLDVPMRPVRVVNTRNTMSANIPLCKCLGEHNEVMIWKRFPHYWPFFQDNPPLISVFPSQRVRNTRLWWFLFLKCSLLLFMHEPFYREFHLTHKLLIFLAQCLQIIFILYGERPPLNYDQSLKWSL